MAAESRVGLAFDSLVQEGAAKLQGDLHGIQVQNALASASITGEAESIRLRTVSRSSPAVAQTVVNPTPGDVDKTVVDARLTGVSPASGHDVVILPRSGSELPRLELAGSDLSLRAASGQLAEFPYVEESRPVYAWNLDSALDGSIKADELTVVGDFLVSVWGWDFRLNDEEVLTGSHRYNQTSVPIVGREVYADTMEQVAQLEVTNGTFRLTNLGNLRVFGDAVRAELGGQSTVAGLVGTLTSQGAPELNGESLTLRDAIIDAARAGDAFVNILHADGAELNGQSIRLVDQDGDARPGTVVEIPAKGTRFSWGFAGSIAALILVAAVAHGPMQGFRFQRIQRRFDDRDYISVLSRIDPFTYRRRFRRRASLLKAVSLLSLEEYREAALYLETLGPLDGPDPATQSFLRACAAAGQGHDSAALQYLGDCLRMDPSYVEEARTVPVLASLLPYFDVSGEPTTA